jgi:uncharacterized protein (TIGR03382 family)
MNNLKLTSLMAGTLILAGTASAGFTGMSFDTVENGMAGYTTYRAYAGVTAGGQVDAVYGDIANELLVTSDGGFYQNAFGGNLSLNINPALYAAFPSLVYDSWVTIGLEDQVGNAMLNIGIDWAGFASGGDIAIDNGTWFATPDDAQVFEIGGRVLIGQFTVADGDHVYGSMNFQGKDADLSNWNADCVSFDSDIVPAPGALALLGLAGIAARRRRK